MKNVSIKVVGTLALTVLLNAGAATLTVTPSTISNTYTGVITLDVGGLTNTEQVVVQRYLDLDANGVVNAGDPLVDKFQIADGGAMIIGGVTNLNVPFDRNLTGGAISTILQFAPPTILESVVGQHIYELVSPSGNFSPVTALFNVTNSVTAQSVSGIVYSNGVTPFVHAVVIVVPQEGGFAGAVVTDGAGHYHLNLNPGAYGIIPTLPNYYCDESAAASAVLTNGMSATNDLFLIGGTVTVSGLVYDAANTNGLGGLMLGVESGDLFGLAFTDANGSYSAAVTPGFWKIKPIKERLPRRAYVSPQNTMQFDTSSGNVTNGDVALYKGNALFYGRVATDLNVPFANIEIEGGDGSNNLYSVKGVSDANGNYTVAVLGAVSSDWSVNPNSTANVVLNNYVLNQAHNTNIAVGQAILQDFTALPVTAHITGQVHDNLGNPVSGVSMYADTFTGGNSYSSLNTETDNDGNYSLGVASGSWQVKFSYGNEGSLESQGLVDYFQPHSVTIPPTNVVLNITVYQNGTPAMSQPQRVSSTQFGFKINGEVGVNYTVQVSTNLASANWATLYTLQLTNSPFSIVDTTATNNARFYRVLKN